MGIYAVTGGSGCVGAETIKLLKKRGHQTLNIDIKKADIPADLSLPEGRQKAIDELYRRCPYGLDGLICCAAVSGACGDLKRIVAVNYFGTIAIAIGAFDLLQKKNGSCVIVSSNIISQELQRMDLADLMNNNSDSEHKILNLVSGLDAMDLKTGISVYAATKYALARWVRRCSASYAANGVRINAVAPGNVGSAMTATMPAGAKAAISTLPVPTKYKEQTLMRPSEIAKVIAFLASEDACGVNGIVMFADGGTDALLNTEKVY